MWGGVLIPEGTNINTPDSFFFQTGNAMPPMIAFCGGLDLTFPPTNKKLRFPINQPLFLSENYCLVDMSGSTTYSITPNQDNNGYILGSQDIYDMLKRNSVPTELYLDTDMGHGLTEGNPDFGLPGTPTNNQLQLYIVQRAATFFQAVVNNQAGNLITTKFVNCENYRNTCNTANNNNSCP